MSLPSFSVRQIVLVNLLFVILMVAGWQVARRVPIDVFPDISFNVSVVTTVWAGASADEAERLVTTKLEDEIDDIVGIKELTSFSSAGLSNIEVRWIETLPDIEYESAINDLRAAIDRVGDLPEDAEEPILTELSVGEINPMVMVAVSDAGGVGEYTLREVARDLEKKLSQLPGVRKVIVRGERERELRVYVDKDRALQYDLTLPEISRVITRNNQNVPGGSFTNEADQEITVRGIGQYPTPASLAETVVRKNPDGTHVKLGELAEIRPDFEKRRMFGRFNGKPAILLGVAKKTEADVIDMVDGVKAFVAQQQALLPPGIEAKATWDFSDYVASRLDLMRSNLLLGIVFVVFILWFTVGFRNALLAIVGVPFSFLTAMILFPVFDVTINSLSLVGFVMVSGMLVDDAIIILENIYHHVEEGKPLREAVIVGAEEVMWPVTAAIATTVAAFLPMLLIQGTSGEFMSILPKTVILCLAGSLLEALVILPAHYLDWGTRRPAADSLAEKGEQATGLSAASYRLRARVDAGIDAARDAYGRAQAAVLESRYAFLGMCVAALIFTLGLGSHVPVDLFPSDFNNLFVTVRTPTDFGVDQTDPVLMRMEAAAEEVSEELTDYIAIVGQGMSADEIPIFASNYGLLFVEFPNTRENIADPNRVLAIVRDAVGRSVEADGRGIDDVLVSAPRNGPPIGTPVAIRVQSDDYDLAKQVAEEVKGELRGVPGVYNVEDNVPVGPRELRIALDEHRASLHGLTFDDVGQTLRSANDGLVSSTFKDPLSDEDVDIRVLLREEQRRSISDLLDLEVRTPAGYAVKVRDVASVEMVRGYQRLYHYDAKRAVVVYAKVDGRQATSISVNEEMQARFADVGKRYPGVDLIFGGEFQVADETFTQMRQALFIALLAIYAILAAQFRSYLQPLVVMSVVTFAYIGVVVGMWILNVTLGGYAMSMYVMYGLVGLAGIVVNDSLVLIDFVNRERERGTPPEEAVRIAGKRRFRPILLTTLTTVAGLLPMALGIGGKSPVFAPFATAIVFGLAAASLLTLFVVPSLYMALEDLKRRIGRGAETAQTAGKPLPVAGGE
ncbi:MAG: efflux RND transporter permease subunit [Deltaproteobacteria bacterium]|nr:efflux RND transporter permease subunit [Deltaproteobacteria bacterium]